MKVSAIILLIALLLTGCAFGAVEDMLSPPRLTDEQQAVYTALADSKGTGFKLKYPRTGEHRSAFVIYGENHDAAIVFYEVSGINVERSLFMNFLYKNNIGEWESLYEIPIRGIDIESVTFASFGEDEQEAIILSYPVGQNEKKCMVISHDADGRPERRFDDIYSFMYVDYFFGRDYKELLIIKNDRSGASATATFLTFREEQLMRSARVGLDYGAGEYTEIMQGYIMPDTPALFINHRRYDSADSFGMDVLFYQGRRLMNPVIQNPENPERVLRRTGLVTELANPRDIDGDGIIMLAASTGEFLGYEHLPPQEKLRPVIWRVLTDDGLTQMHHSYFTERNDFVFLLPGRWIHTVTAAVSLEENTVSFFRAGLPIEEADELILSIATVFDVESADELLNTGEWFFFRENPESGFMYFIKVPAPENPLTLTAEEFENAFRILSKIGKNDVE
jgi:hypothetical protein